jgi:hypothetical protein
MAQFIRTPIDIDDIHGILHLSSQVSQISYHDERVIEIDWHYETRRVVIQDNGQWFFLHSPDIDNLTINHVLGALGYANEIAIITWADGEINDVLNSTVEHAPLNQIALYGPNQPIPEVHNQGPLPAIAGQPIPNADQEPDFGPFQNAPIIINDNDDDDSQSNITYPSTDDEDDTRHY